MTTTSAEDLTNSLNTTTRQSPRTSSSTTSKRVATEDASSPPPAKRKFESRTEETSFEFVSRRLRKLSTLKADRTHLQTFQFFLNSNGQVGNFDAWLSEHTDTQAVQAHLATDAELFDLGSYLEKYVSRGVSAVKREEPEAEPVTPAVKVAESVEETREQSQPCVTPAVVPPASVEASTSAPSVQIAVTPTKTVQGAKSNTAKSPRTPKPELSEPSVRKSPTKTLSQKRPRISPSPAEGSIELAAKQEATVLSRISELRRNGLWSSNRLPKCADPPRSKTHWDYVLEEMRWMHIDFVQERRFKRAAARKFASLAARKLKDEEQLQVRKKAEAERELRRIAASVAKQVREFWKSIDKVVEYKTQTIIESKKRRALDQHLDFIVTQTEKFSSMVQEGLTRSVTPSTTGTKTPSLKDEDFDGASDSDDDETTIAKAERGADQLDVADEVAALQKESEMSFDDWLEMLPEGYLNTRDKPISDDEASSSSSAAEGSESDADDASEERPPSSRSTASVEPSTSETLAATPQTSRPSSRLSYAFDGVDFNKLQSEDSEERQLELTHIAEAAQKFQPKGYTLETTQVVTKVPFLLKHKLREYQHVGLDWLVTLYDKSLNGILADEMGLGKTIQTIALLAHLACERRNWGPHLIVVPTTVILNWEMELKKWCPAFKILTYFGQQKERKEKRKGWSKPNAFHVCITSYKLVTQDIRAFKQKRWEYFILDEAQNIKNFKSQRWQLLMNMNARRRLLLTGTPLQNSLMELWSLMHFLMPNVFQSHKDFRDWFNNPLTGIVEGSLEYNTQIIQRLHKVLRPFILRRLKSQVEKQLPKKYEHLLMCPLSKRQRFLYDDFMARGSTKDQLSSGNVMSVLNILMQLRKVCNHPNLFEPRPVVSPFVVAPLNLEYPALVRDIARTDPIESVHVPELFLLGESRLASERRRQMCGKKLIEDIDSKAGDERPALPIDRTFRFHSAHTSSSSADNRGPDFVVPTTMSQSMNLNNSFWLEINGARTAIIPMTLQLPDTPLAHNSMQTIGLSLPQRSPGQTAAPVYSLVSSGVCQPPTLTLSQSQQVSIMSPPRAPGVVSVAPATSAQPSQTLKPLAPRISVVSASGPSYIAARTDTSRGKSGWFPIRPQSKPVITVREQMPRQPVQVIQVDPKVNPARPVGGSWQPIAKSASMGAVPRALQPLARSVTDATAHKVQTTVVRRPPEPPLKKVKLEPLLSNNSSRPVVKSASESAVKRPVAPSSSKERDDVEMNEVTERHKSWRSSTLHRLAVENLKRCQYDTVFTEGFVDLLQRLAVDEFESDAVDPSSTLSHWLRSILERLLLTVNPVFNGPPRLSSSSAGRCPYWTTLDNNWNENLSRQIRRLVSPLQTRLSEMHRLQFPELRLIEYDCGKLQRLTELLRNLHVDAHRCLIFTQMSKMLDVLEAFLSYHGYKYLRLDGSTKIEQRQVLMERFNADRRIFCFILSTRSGGLGVNLTGADTVIFYDSDWNPTMDAQAQDRCHRIGQTRDVHIYRLVSENTVEENILKKATQKRKLGDIAIEEAGFTAEFFKQGNIRDLFNVEQQSVDVPSQKELETVMEGLEDAEDVVAAHRANDEVRAELAEFDDSQAATGNTGDETDKGDTELDSLIEQLKPVERYALRFLEQEQLPEFEAELKRTDEEIEHQKKEWVEAHEQALKEEQQKMEEDERAEFDLTYSTNVNAAEMYCPMDPDAMMPTWLPPSPPPSDSEPDLYVDPVLNFWYEAEPMAESQLPPVYQELTAMSPRKEERNTLNYRQRNSVDDAVNTVRDRFHKTVTREKQRHSMAPKSSETLTVHSYTPQTLFDGGPSCKHRSDVRRALTPPPPVLEHDTYEGQEWCVIEDLIMLMAITKEQQMTYNLLSTNFGHTPNWDFLSKLVTEKWDHYRSPRQCSLRYQLVVLPREESRLVAIDPLSKKPRKCPLSSQELANMKKGRVNTVQQFQHDSPQLMNCRTVNRFKAVRTSVVRRCQPVKPRRYAITENNIPTKLNEMHEKMLNSAAVSYDSVLSAAQLADLREERLKEKRKQDKIRQQQQLMEQQQRQRQQEMEPPSSRMSAGGTHNDHGGGSTYIMTQLQPPGCRIVGGQARRLETNSQLPKDHQDLAVPPSSIPISTPYTVVISQENLSPAVTIPSGGRTAYATARVQSGASYRQIAPHQPTKQRTPPATAMSSQYQQLYTTSGRSTITVSAQQPVQIESASSRIQDIRPKVAVAQSGGQQYSRILVQTDMAPQGTRYIVPTQSGGSVRMAANTRAGFAQLTRRNVTTGAAGLPKIQTLGQQAQMNRSIMFQGQQVTRVAPASQMQAMRAVGVGRGVAQGPNKIPSISVIMPVAREHIVPVSANESEQQAAVTTEPSTESQAQFGESSEENE